MEQDKKGEAHQEHHAADEPSRRLERRRPAGVDEAFQISQKRHSPADDRNKPPRLETPAGKAAGKTGPACARII
jgi:hypothetical protein